MSINIQEILEQHRLWLENSSIGKRANLSNVDLRYANLRYVDLRYANLSNVDLRYANLSNVDLRYANLRYVDLRYANLRYVDLRYANLSNATIVIGPQRQDGYLFWLIQPNIIRAGCRTFTIEQAKEHWSKLSDNDYRKELNEESLLIVEYLEKRAKQKGWI